MSCNHFTCQHSTLKYCPCCGKVYCVNCGKTWTAEYEYYRTIYPTNPYISPYTITWASTYNNTCQHEGGEVNEQGNG
jgi:hypothetical protein